MSDLAKRAVACKHWRRMPGMLRRATGPHPSGPQGPRTERWDEDDAFWSDTDWLPDLTDPCTLLGGLLALVREAWGRPNLVAYYAPLASGQGWYVGDRFCGDRDYPVVETPSETEAAALVAALEVAP